MQIKELILKSKNLEAQETFYAQRLGLSVLSKRIDEISFQIGKSILTLVRSDDFTPYHFAINTPSQSEVEMHAFLKNKIELLPHEGQEIVDFTNWNAKALYFYDEDKNIVEFISRNNLHYPKSTHFDAHSLIEISEIGMPTMDIRREYEKLHNHFGLELYDKGDGNFQRFCAIGDEQGLFICINRNVKKWIPTNEEAFSSEFTMLMKNNGEEFKLEYKNGEIMLNL